MRQNTPPNRRSLEKNKPEYHRLKEQETSFLYINVTNIPGIFYSPPPVVIPLSLCSHRVWKKEKRMHHLTPRLLPLWELYEMNPENKPRSLNNSELKSLSELEKKRKSAVAPLDTFLWNVLPSGRSSTRRDKSSNEQQVTLVLTSNVASDVACMASKPGIINFLLL